MLGWQERFALVEEQVMKPRNKERTAIAEGRLASRYDYADEPFRVRRKEFWPLPQADKVRISCIVLHVAQLANLMRLSCPRMRSSPLCDQPKSSPKPSPSINACKCALL